MTGIVLLDGLGLLEGNVKIPRQDQGEMGASRGLILDPHHLAVLEDGKAGGAAADVHHHAVFDLVDGVGGGGLIQDVGHLKAGALRHVLVGLGAGFGAGGHGDGTVDQLGAQPLLQLRFELLDDPQRPGVVHHHAVPQDLRRLLFTGDGVVLLVQDDHDDVGRAQVQAHLQLVADGLEGLGLRFLHTGHIGVDAVQIHHVFGAPLSS